jgi:hypothetical protein
MVFEDDTQMLQVYLNMPYCDFNKEIKTFHKFFVRFSESDLWNSLDENLIDKTVYPNGNVMITSNHEFVNIGTESEPNLVSKYDYFKYSALGRGIENELKRDGIQRLVDAGIYVKP